MVKLQGNDAESALLNHMVPPVELVYVVCITLGFLVAWLLWYIPERRRCEEKNNG